MKIKNIKINLKMKWPKSVDKVETVSWLGWTRNNFCPPPYKKRAARFASFKKQALVDPTRGSHQTWSVQILECIGQSDLTWANIIAAGSERNESPRMAAMFYVHAFLVLQDHKLIYCNNNAIIFGCSNGQSRCSITRSLNNDSSHAQLNLAHLSFRPSSALAQISLTRYRSA